MTSQNKNLRLVFIAAIFFVFILSFFSYTKINSLIESAAWVNHSTQVTLGLEKVIGTLKDAETGHRGYLLTHEKTFLESFSKALNEYPQNIKAVKQITIDNGEQQKSLATVELLAQHREDYFRKMLEIDKSRTPTPAELLIGKSIMDSLRTEVNIMIARENNLLEQRSKKLHEQSVIAPAMLFSLSIIALVILIISYWQLNKSLLQAQKLKEEKIEQAIQLERTKEINDSEKRFNLMLIKSPFCFAVVKGGDMVIALANTAVKELWAKGDDIEGKPLLEILPELAGTGFPGILQNVITTGIPYYGYDTLAQLNRNGKTEDCYFNFVYQPYYEADETISGVTIIAIEVTKEVQAKKQLEEADNRFRSMVNQAPVAICVLRDANFVVEIANEKQLQLWGKTKEEVLNIPVFDAVPETAGQGFEELLSGVFTNGKPFIANEVPVTLSRNGKKEIIYVNFVYEPLYNNEHKIDGVLAVTIDVSEQVLAKKKVEDSEKRYNLMLMQSPFAFLVLKGKDMLVHLANESMKEVLGKGSDIEGKPLLEVLPEIKGQAFPRLLDKVYNTGIPFSANEMIAQLTRNGQLENVYFNYVYQPYYEADKTISGVTVIAYDVTSSVIANKKIEESKQKLDIVIDASELGTYELNLLTDEVIYSDKYLEIFGFPKGTSPTHSELISRLHPDEMQLRNKAFKDALVSGTLFYQAKLVWNDESIHWVAVKGKVFYNEEKKPVKLIGTVGDITEEKFKQLELTESESKLRTLSNTLEKQVLARTRELEQKNIDLEKMNKELQSFAYISSHDLQEPLRKIQTFTSRINEKEENNLSDSGKDMFKRMQDAAERMQTLIQDLLAYSRTDITERKFETTDLNEIIAEVKEDLKEELNEKHAIIETHQLCDADIIPFQFRQLMHNLIGNSLKFSNPNFPPIIKIKSEIANGIKFNNEKLPPQNKYCHITVSDNGIGFEQQYSEKIFEVFQRLHGKNEYNGTGIGLSIVKKIVENHNGIITANGELNKGATFDIYIPAT